MLFCTPAFLFTFLPIVFAIFVALPARLRTPFLSFASLFFYAWGEHARVLLMAGSITVNWAAGLWVARATTPRARRALVVGAAVFNIGALVFFKYSSFLIANLNTLRALRGHAPFPDPQVGLPLGISFVTFEALSYVIDVYRGEITAKRNPLHVGFYVAFFPHLIAGPIVRFKNIAANLDAPATSESQLADGLVRFIVGMAKKVLLANTLGPLADAAFAAHEGTLRTSVAWLGIVAYALQIYFDFSGYSDMAIGLGKMFGFQLPENFRRPYTALSVQDFWRRWHMTLSSWFRDYLYIPLGGSRVSPARQARNLIIVFFLCGLWHGASWAFVAWGLFHGFFLSIERFRFGVWMAKRPALVRQAYALAVVLMGWVFFRADSFAHALGYVSALLGGAGAAGADAPSVITLLTRESTLALLVGTVLALRPDHPASADDRWLVGSRGVAVASAVGYVALFVVSVLYMAASTYNPFIYFRF